jgi:hypothetical protein
MMIHCLIKGSRLIEPPWLEDAWEQASEARAAGTGDLSGFWPLGAPALILVEPGLAPARVVEVGEGVAGVRCSVRPEETQ